MCQAGGVGGMAHEWKEALSQSDIIWPRAV